MRVLLISANTNTEPYAVYPLGIDYVAGAIAARHQVKVADMNTLDGYPALAALIRTWDPQLVGIGLRNVDTTDTVNLRGFVDSYRELVSVVRKASRTVVVLGGSGFTIFPRQMMQQLAADYGVVGEGERLAQLVDAIEAGNDPAGITGIITLRGAETIPQPLDQSFVRRFQADDADLQFYLQRGGMLNLQTKRGCRYNCVYCTYPHIEGRRLRFMAPEEVAQTALELQAAGARYLFITDAVFNADYAHSAAVARAFKKVGLAVPWGAFFTPTNPPAGYYDLLAAAGMTHAEFGTEALSNRVLKAYKKPFYTLQVFKAHQQARRAGLYVAHYLLLGGPGENIETLDKTLDNVEKLEKCVLFFFCGMRIYPHTDLHATAMREGVISETQSLLTPVFYRTTELDERKIYARVRQQAGGRINWVIGSGGQETAALMARMYRRGYSGPLWEYLIR